ncbi:flagellar hook-associated protein FlgL [Hathewaya histolytica]|uniref:Flagellar hook-associated protein 3 n=1 Tax=Hathewaya histolytica TaxID=1498 RepID=A0A4U9RA05_HATHI|nr:flagellar hook-associated protein FlgL [Hathewaya histolytica]VTQ87601.1 flagellar hook-associated protein 3 [Hathewaya histolytica]
MRITNKMLSNNFLRDLSVNINNFNKINEQVTSKKEFRRPSDDPFKVARAMQLHTDININKQYNKNIKDTINYLNVTDTALGQGVDVLKRINELLVSAGDAPYGSGERSAINDEIKQKVDEFGQILNTNFDGKYVFGGSRGTTKPIEVIKENGKIELKYFKKEGGHLDLSKPEDLEQFNTLNQKLKMEISQGVVLDYNATSIEVMQFKTDKGEERDLMKIFKSITNHLDGKDSDGTADSKDAIDKLLTDDLEGIKDSISNLLKIRSEVGAKQNRMDSAKEKNDEQNFNLKEILSNTEDIDVTEKSIEFNIAYAVLISTLQASAKVIQPSLLDFLR